MENKDLHSKVEQALRSFDQIKRAEANPFLFTRVIEKMQQPAPGILKPWVVWQLATSMVIIIGLNIGIGLYAFNKKTTTGRQTESRYFTNHIYNY